MPDQPQALGPRPAPLPAAPDLPALVGRAGPAAVFAAEEFFYAAIANEHTRSAYRAAVERFLARCEERGLTLERIAPKDVGQAEEESDHGARDLQPAGLLRKTFPCPLVLAVRLRYSFFRHTVPTLHTIQFIPIIDTI